MSKQRVIMDPMKKKKSYEVSGLATKNVNSDSIKNRNTIIFESSMLHNVKIVVDGNLVTMTGEMKEQNSHLFSRQLENENCETLLSNDGKHVEVNCSTLKDNELRLGVSRTTFTEKQIELLAVCFIKCSHWPFKALVQKVSKSPSLKNENFAKIHKWFYNTYRTFKAGKYPRWAVDPTTKQPYYRYEVNELDGKMRLFPVDSDEDTLISLRKSKIIPPKVFAKEAVHNPKRKLHSESLAEETKKCGVKYSPEYTDPILSNIKQEVVDYEVQYKKLPSNYKIPHLSTSSNYQRCDTEYPYSKYIKLEHPMSPGENKLSVISSSISDGSKTTTEVERTTNSKKRSVDQNIHQKMPEPNKKELSSKRRRKVHRKANSASSVVPPDKIAELKATMQQRQKVGNQELVRRVLHEKEESLKLKHQMEKEILEKEHHKEVLNFRRVHWETRQ